MGLEYHNRYRDRLGRFAVDDQEPRKVQLNLKVAPEIAAGVRARAPGSMLEFGEYVSKVLLAHWMNQANYSPAGAPAGGDKANPRGKPELPSPPAGGTTGNEQHHERSENEEAVAGRSGARRWTGGQPHDSTGSGGNAAAGEG